MLDNIVQNLLKSYESNSDMTNLQAWALPSRACVTDLTHKLESLLYPGLIDSIRNEAGLSYAIGYRVAEIYKTLQELITDCLKYAASCTKCRMSSSDSNLSFEKQAEGITEYFFEQLPKVRSILQIDLHAAYKGDPAAKSGDEVIVSYPGLEAIIVYRIAHFLYECGVPVIPRIMSEHVHGKTGIDIHPGAKIGESFFIDHGTGVVIGETSVIGKNVKIYQGVTLGALSVKKSLQNKKRHPTIEDDVTIYANATILGGETVIGKGSVIGGNSWITESVSNAKA